MGPDSSPPTHLFYINSETGEPQEITDRIAELSVIEQITDSITKTEGWTEVSAGFLCRHCEHADCKRTHDGKIRCKRWSQWVEPTAHSCKEYGYSIPFQFDPVQQAEIMEYFQNQGGKYTS